MHKCQNAQFLVNKPAIVKTRAFRLRVFEQFTRVMVIVAEVMRTMELLFLKVLPFASH